MKPSTKKILEDAKAFVEQKKAEGWTRADFAFALGEFLKEPTNFGSPVVSAFDIAHNGGIAGDVYGDHWED